MSSTGLNLPQLRASAQAVALQKTGIKDKGMFSEKLKTQLVEDFVSKPIWLHVKHCWLLHDPLFSSLLQV